METKNLINYTKEAFSLPANLAFLIGVLGGSLAAFFTGLQDLAAPIAFTGAGLEMAYLALAPGNKRFRRAVQSRYGATTERLQAQVKNLTLLRQLDKASLDKYTELHRKKAAIYENLMRHTVTSGAFAESYAQKVHQIEAFYVQLLFEIAQYRKFLKTENSSGIEKELSQLQTEMGAAGSAKVRELYQKRIDLLGRRKDKNLSVQEQYEMARIQLDTLEDMLDYLQEQSLTVSSMDEVSRTIDNILNESEEHHASIQEIQGITTPAYITGLEADAAPEEDDASRPRGQAPQALR